MTLNSLHNNHNHINIHQYFTLDGETCTVLRYRALHAQELQLDTSFITLHLSCLFSLSLLSVSRLSLLLLLVFGNSSPVFSLTVCLLQFRLQLFIRSTQFRYRLVGQKFFKSPFFNIITLIFLKTLNIFHRPLQNLRLGCSGGGNQICLFLDPSIN